MINYLIKIYISSAKDACLRMSGTYSVLLGLVVLALCYMILTPLAYNAGSLGGFIISLLDAAAISFYLAWLREISQSRRIKISELLNFDWGIFQAVISLMFIYFLFDLAFGMLTRGMNLGWMYAIVQLLIVVLLNSLPETLYLGRRDGIDAVKESFSFTTKNWIEWYLPYLVMTSPLLFVGMSLPRMLANTSVLFPAEALIRVPDILLPALKFLTLPLGLILAHWFMLFRAKLYAELEVGSRRQRMFKVRMS